MKRRVLAMLLVIVMVFGMLPMQALADEVLLEESAAEALIEETEAPVEETEAPAEEAETPEEETEALPEETEDLPEETESPTEEPLLEEPELLLVEEAADTLLADDAESEGTDSEAKTVTVSIVAQYGGALLMQPQIDVEVSGDLAERYGYKDEVTDGVSGLDVLVKAHEAAFGADFTKEDASTYLAVSNNFVTTMFGIKDSNICFMIDGRQPGSYAIPQAPVLTGDTVEFAFYQDTVEWSDNYVWLELEDGTKLDGQTVSAGTTVNVVVKGYSPFGSWAWETEEDFQKNSVTIAGAKLALVDMETGALTDLNVTTDASGKASITVPRDYANSKRILTAYGDYMMMSLAEVSVGEATEEITLTGLEIAVGGGTMDETTEQTLTPAFSGDTMSYSTPILDYVADSTGRFAWVKATAPEGTTLTAKCGSSDVATLTSGEWTRLDVYKYWPDYKYIGTLETGTYNEVKITLSAAGQDDKVYTVTVPMQPDIANRALTWKANLKSAIYYTTNAEASALSVEAQYKNRPLGNEDVITYQWYQSTTASTEGGTAIAGADSASFTPSTAQTGVTYYYVVASCGDLESISNMIEVTVTDKSAPKSITLTYEYPYTFPNTWNIALGGVTFVAGIGDTIQIHAVDEEGNETPVSWSTQCYGGTLDEKTGVYTITSGSYSYLTAYSLYDPSISSGEKVIQTTDYKISNYNRDQSVALSSDGQTKRTTSLSGGVSGYNIWDIKMEPEGIAECTTDLTQKGASVEFNLLRPGTITISYTVDVGGKDDPVLTDSTTLTITGAAVEDAQGNQGKTYLELTGENKAPTAQLKAYLMDGRTVAGWSSVDEAVATVDENGLVTAHAIGATIITVTDSEGTTGGIKVVVTDADKPTFENIAFTVGNMWSNGVTRQIEFKPATTAYTGLELTRYNTTSLDLTAATLYNTEKLTAVATYTDSNGEAAAVPVNSGAATKLTNIPFGTSTVTITLTDKEDNTKQTAYTFEVTRPRDTTQVVYSNTGIVMKDAEGGALSADQYKEKAEGYLFRANDDGTIKNAYTVYPGELYYRAYLLDGRPSFTMQTKGNSDYVHMRYSVDEGETWKELSQGGGLSDEITFPERTDSNPVVKIILQVVSDKTYVDGGNTFPETVTSSNGSTYTVWVEQLPSADAVKMLTAAADTGEWYPAFDSDVTSYRLSVANGSAAPVLTYTIAEGSTVSVGSEKQEPNEAGEYTLTLTNSAQTVTVTSADGSIRRQYSFQYFERVAGGADKVVDYLCVNSQYTNSGAYGLYPEFTLGSNSLKSLGNFGGYITYYFENALTDDPANKYGVDFYIDGNAFKDTSTGTGLGSMEPGQVWVSEDGSTWYALAGSEHYDADTLWDYTVTYSKNGTGTSWSDNYGNSDRTVGRSFSWPLAENYPLNQLAKNDSFTITGILIPSVKGITGNDDFSTYSSGARFGYVDVLVNGTANPYAENDSYQNTSSGFDLAWAVDAAGNPVDVSGMEFHYVKVVTASNIIAGAANEKSTEVANITRADAQGASVGVTKAPTSITFSDGEKTYKLPVQQDKQVYEVALDMQNVSIAVNGSAGDNIYINNQRVASGTAAEGFVLNADGETLIRIIVQNGNREPVIYLLKLSVGTDASLESVTLASPETEVVGGKSITLKAVDGSGKAIKTSNIRWSLADPDDAAYATITTAGVLKTYAVAAEHDVSLVAELVSSYSDIRLLLNHTVTVRPAVTQVEIRKGEENVTGKTLYLNASADASLSLTGKLFPADAKEGIDWKSSNTSVATVANGVVSFANKGKTGTVTITATAKDGSGKKASVTVQVGTLTEKVTITAPTTTTLRSGASLTLKAATEPEKPTVAGCTFALVEASDSAYATVSTGGKVTAKTVNEPHEIKIVATSKDAAKVQSEPLTLTILPKSQQMLILKSGNDYVTGKTLVRNADEETISLSAYLLDTTDGTKESAAEVTWTTSKGSVASVENGTVTIKKAGTAVITAVSGKLKASVTINVTNLVGEIIVTPKSANDDLTIASGKAVALKATVLPTNAANKKVTWSITEGASYAKVSGSGVLTANKDLTETVKVTVTAAAVDGSGIVGSAVVTINPISQGVRILLDGREPTNTTLVWDMQQNAELDLSAKVYPIDAEQDVVWTSSSSKVAAVDAEGKVTCLKAGTVTITAAAKDGSGKKASFKLTVVKRMTELGLSGNDVIAGGKSLTLKPVITPADTTNKKLTWSISENTIGAKINSSGVLTTKAVKEPVEVTITAAAQDGSGMTATHKVTIYPATTKVTLSAEGYEKLPTKLAVGETLTLAASCNEGAANQYTWSSSSTKVATVDADGVITPVQPGTVTITATAKDGTGKKASIKLTVVQLMKILTLSGNDIVAGSKSLTLKAAIDPANTTNKKLTWSISENTVGAKIDSSGKLTTKAVKEPVTVIITAAAQDGSGKTATHTVTIYPATTRVTLTAEDGGAVPKELAVGTDLKLKGFCEGAANEYTWKSDNKNVTVTDGTVVADAKAVGKTVTITCTAADGTGKSASVKIKIVGQK